MGDDKILAKSSKNSVGKIVLHKVGQQLPTAEICLKQKKFEIKKIESYKRCSFKKC
jgi:hypothetical protein